MLKKVNWTKVMQFGIASLVTLAPATVALALKSPDCPSGINCFTADNLNDFIVKIINYILAVVLAIDILFLIIGGFFYLTSAGSDAQAKKGKTTVVNAVIGLIIIMLAYVIANVIAGFFENFQ